MMIILKIRLVFFLLILILFTVFLPGCSEVKNIEAKAPPFTQVTSSKTITVTTPTASTQIMTEASKSNETLVDKKISTFKDISVYIELTKIDVFNKLGKDYKIVPAGGEGTEEGYYFEDIGLSFVFNRDDNGSKIAWIDCYDNTDINGANNGMSFAKVMEKLGNTVIEDTFIETPDHKAYELNYIIDNCKVNYFSQNKDGTDGGFTIYPYDQISQIKNIFANKQDFKIYFYSDKPSSGQVEFDFNKDGQTEVLMYSTDTKKNEYGNNFVSKCILRIGDFSITHEYANTDDVTGGICYLAISDVNINDAFVEFYISEGELSDREENTFYRLTEKGIGKICTIPTSIMGYSGSGQVYFWDGMLYDTMDTDLVLVYYDFDQKRYIQSDQIVGKKIKSDSDIYLYKTNEDVVFGPPLTDEDIKAKSGDKIIKTINAGEEFTVIEIDHNAAFNITKDNEWNNFLFFRDNGIKVKTSDDIEGWIGGFHMVWD